MKFERLKSIISSISPYFVLSATEIPLNLPSISVKLTYDPCDLFLLEDEMKNGSFPVEIH